MNIKQATKGLATPGRANLIKHLTGQKISFKARCSAKCFECMGGYADGRADCRIKECPLYPVMPFREGRPKTVSKAVKPSKSNDLQTPEAQP
jgi:hypothetical protein